MKLILALPILILSLAASAVEIRSRIYDIDLAPSQGGPHVVMMEDGQVGFVTNDESLLVELKKSKELGDLIQLQLDEQREVISVQTILRGSGRREIEPKSDEVMTYVPTVISSLDEATSIFGKMKRGWQNQSQCYNRAHVWAYEEFNRSQLNSIKLFLFFTRRYIRNYRYKWWFHVSPMAYVSEDGQTVQRVLDRRYTSGPRYVKTWTDNFIATKRNCPVVSKYSDYRNNQEKEDCYLIPVSMYFWQPRDIERFERTGYEKTRFIKSEVDWAYTEAF